MKLFSYATAAVLFTVTLFPVQVWAQATETETSPQDVTLPSAEEVIAAHIQAIGGEEKYSSLHSLKAEGEISVQGMSGTITTLNKDDKILVETNMQGMGTQQEGVNGEVAWRNMMGQVMVLEGKQAEQLKEETDLTPLLDLESKYTLVECVGKEEFNDEECYVLVFKKTDSESRQYFSVTTGLQTGVQMERELPNIGTVEFTIFLHDYRDIDGLKFSHTQKIDLDIAAMKVKLETIELNPELDDSLFDIPTEDEQR